MKTTFFNTFINITNIDEQKKVLITALSSKEKKIFYYLNSYSYYLTEKDHEFREAFNKANYIMPDGMGIVWGVRFINNISIEKVTHNHSFFEYILDELQNHNSSIYLLGSTDKTIKKAHDKLIKEHPGINISGKHHGYFEESESDKIIEEINSCAPSILLVGMGMPKTEKWIFRHYNKFGNYIIMSVGNLIDLIAGEKKIAPKFFYSSGFEWLYRSIQEPRRLFPRYFKSHLFLIYKILSYKFRNAFNALSRE